MKGGILSIQSVKEVAVIDRNEEIDISNSDIPYINTFQSSERHTDVISYDMSEWWVIILTQANIALKKTTQKFLYRAVLPLASRYRMENVFTVKTLQGQWLCGTMNGRCKSKYGNQYDQVFANNSYFVEVYPMDSKINSGDALKLFCQYFGVPEKLMFDGSK